jgi:mannose-6-phosphate isomerase-like protein (cupin superfamily)
MITISAPVRVDKPWGHEHLIVDSDGKVVAKTLHIIKASRTSLQYHKKRSEIMTFLDDGYLEVPCMITEHDSPDHVEFARVYLRTGTSVVIPANTIHRVSSLADTPLSLLECFPRPEDYDDTDIVRMEDDYGRSM